MTTLEQIDHDHQDTDLTDPHGEAEMLRAERDALRAEGFAAGWAAAIDGAADYLEDDADRLLGEYQREMRNAATAVRAIPMPADIAPLLSAREAQVQWVKPDLSHGWLIYKARRGWYRPSARGYTSRVAEAGRYSREDALSYSHPNGLDGPRDEITIRHEREFPELPADASAALDRRLREARAQGMREAARIIQTRADEYTIEHGAYDGDTGVTEYPGNGDEWVEEWAELSEAILARAAEIEEGAADG